METTGRGDMTRPCFRPGRRRNGTLQWMELGGESEIDAELDELKEEAAKTIF